jgi:uncharacterized protein (TIGR02569 family)
LIPEAVLEAFGASGPHQLLDGGQGSSIRVGAMVLKPVDFADDAAWCAQVLDDVVEDGFRVARPIAASDGRWVVAGWVASSFVEGLERVGERWDALFAAGRAFHAAVAHLPRPGFLDERTDRWSTADRVVWGERTIELEAPAAAVAERLWPAVEPLAMSGQVIHGDLAGNVLFGEGPPLILDFSAYWRNPAWAEAVVCVDALLWWDASAAILDVLPADLRRQLALRALLFRVITGSERLRAGGPPDDWHLAEHVADILLSAT